MPKLPKRNLLILAVSAVILIIVLTFVFTSNLATKKSNTTVTKPNPIKSNFSGSVISTSVSSQTLEVRNSTDKKVYKVKLDKNVTVTTLGLPSSFANIKVGDQIVVYSKTDNLNQSQTYLVHMADLQKLPDTIKKP